MNSLVPLPVLLPILGAGASLALLHHPRTQRWLSLAVLGSVVAVAAVPGVPGIAASFARRSIAKTSAGPNSVGTGLSGANATPSRSTNPVTPARYAGSGAANPNPCGSSKSAMVGT